MTERSPEPASASSSLPDAPDLDWLRKEAKRRLRELRATRPDAKLADAQLAIARQYGFPSWRALKAHVDSLTTDGQLLAAAGTGDTATLAALLDRHGDKLHARSKPYAWTLLHQAAHGGHLAAVELLLERGLDANVRERGDNTYPMHWAAAAGHLPVVRRLADAGGDVVGRGDVHELEVIGWATCWHGCDDAAHRAIADFLVSRGARHHIFSAVALELDDEVRRIVAADPAALDATMSRNEGRQRPLHFAVRMNRPRMVALLLELGADPLATDDAGEPAIAYVTGADADRPLMEALRAIGRMDLLTAVALRDWDAAAALLHQAAEFGALHLAAKRGDVAGVKWLLDRGADPNAAWSHGDARVTPLHLAAMFAQADVVRLLLDAGADPTIRDSKHDGDALGWAEHAGRTENVRVLAARTPRAR
jgi:ankyrin repeat protein